jgi:DNA-directed RNA polymerase specialized sigma24 family protein
MTLDKFDEMLSWLDPDRQKAVEKYGKIRGRIIKIYTNRGCRFADEIADETDVRVCRRIGEVVAKWNKGDDPALYFYKVAKYVYLETTHRPSVGLPLTAPEPSEGKELLHACLDRCLSQLQPQQRELILEFHEGEKGVRIENRQRLAAKHGINTKALSLRAFRLHRALRPCLDECLMAHRFEEINSEVSH